MSPINYSNEPVELRELKRQLANNSCNCKVCAYHTTYSNVGTGFDDKEVQASRKDSFNRYPDVAFHKLDDTKCLSSANLLRKDVLCPGCYMALNLLRNTTKIFKDEESETKPNRTEKSTEKTVKSAEKTTWTTNKSAPNYPDITLCDMMVEYSTDTSVTPTRNLNIDKVSLKNPKLENLVYSRNCLCMENFINTIRPPFINDVTH